METLLKEDYRHYHDASEHGPIYVYLNEMLHLIVLIYSLFGMIRFKVKFIHMVKLVKWFSRFMIAYSWYLTIKFALMAALMFLFSVELDTLELSMSQLNCSLSNEWPLVEAVTKRRQSKLNSSQTGTYTALSASQFGFQLPQVISYPLIMARALNIIGGPYKLLGNLATLMYGFYSMAIYILLAIFPIELFYINIGFNYIRFVLNDPSCMRDFYLKKQKHLDRLNNWSRNKNTSMMTLSMKKTTNQRHLRCLLVFDQHQLTDNKSASNLLVRPMSKFSAQPIKQKPSVFKQSASIFGWLKDTLTLDDQYNNEKDVQLVYTGIKRADLMGVPSRAPLKSLRHSLRTHHQEGPSYAVQVANKNLILFKPHVRSERWFKVSMVLYPIFIFFYFISLFLVIGAISVFFFSKLQITTQECTRRLGYSIDLFADWSFLDSLTFFETQIMVFTLSCASSFYCSYYFGTIMELQIWIAELSQQINLCKLVLELGHRSPSWLAFLPPLDPLEKDGSRVVFHQFRLGPSRNFANSVPKLVDPAVLDVSQHFNQFGGLNSVWANMKFHLMLQSERFKHRQTMAISLVTRRQTLMRATYINMNLFFDELNATRFLTKTILSRTTQLAIGWALLASITRSQFESNYINLTILLGSSLFILNLYLICAASINSGVNKLLPQIHELISASIKTGADHDLLEFWLRHIQAYGTDRDAMSYKIYGYKITWGSILNFNGAVSSAYLFTIY